MRVVSEPVGTRRKFLGTAAAAAIAGTAAGCARGNWRFFSAPEARSLDAMLDCIIPADNAPGACYAGVIQYIDRQLTRHFREHRATYRNGLAAVNRLAAGVYADLPSAGRQQILEDLERNPATRPFIDLLVTHAMQGFYGNPRHGGNRDFVSWRMLGIPPIPVRGRNRYDLGKQGANAKG